MYIMRVHRLSSEGEEGEWTSEGRSNSNYGESYLSD